MKLGIALRTAGIFFAVASATFVATDPAALPDWAKAAIGAAIAGLAAIGITPPTSAAPTANAVYQEFDKVKKVQQQHAAAIGAAVDSVDDIDHAHEETINSIELHLNDIRDRLTQLEGAPTPPPTPPLTAVPPEPEPPAPEVPS